MSDIGRRATSTFYLHHSGHRVLSPSSLDIISNDISSLSLELIVWLVPSLIGDAVAVSLIGVLLGPFYPIVMNHAGRVLPRWLLTASIGWIAGFGQVHPAF